MLAHSTLEVALALSCDDAISSLHTHGRQVVLDVLHRGRPVYWRTLRRARVVVSSLAAICSKEESSVLVLKRPTLTLSIGEPMGFGRDFRPSRKCLRGSATLWKPFW